MTTRGLEAVTTPEIGHVTVRRFILDREAAALMKLAQRVGRRLRVWMRQMGDGVLPDEQWLENARWYGDTVTAMLKEQRMRAAMKTGKPELTDAEADAELAQLATDAIEAMPVADLERLLAQRKAIDVPEAPVPDLAAHRHGPQADFSPQEPEPAASSDLLSFTGGESDAE